MYASGTNRSSKEGRRVRRATSDVVSHFTAALAALAVTSLAFAGPTGAWKIENPVRYIQVGVHLRAPADGMAHNVALPGVFWATPYTWAGAPAAAVNGSAQHLFAPHPGPPWNETAPGPLHAYGLVAPPPPGRAVAVGRLLHGSLHPDVFVEVLAANATAAVFADIGVHDPPPGVCPGFQSAPTAEKEVPPTGSDAVAAASLNFYTPDSTLSMGLVVQGISQLDLTSSAIHLGGEGEIGPVLVDLGPGAAWTDVDGIAIARMLEDYVFPPEHIEALMHGETYINVNTLAYPDGEIRDQITMLPWWDDFEYYPTFSDLHGQGGWKGWGNDPTVSAFVTDTQSLSAVNSVDVAGATDLVHEFDGLRSGQWVFTAWQYIPTGFVGGGGQIPGSSLVMMNTYSDAGPWEESHWSVQMNFDSNDGMLKVYYGNGMNTVNVPYETDRWVEIQVEIDLDLDWTRVYYDDNFVTEYSWTGGVLGNGGGALDIAAVDLYANNSTSIYYDDLSLEPISEPECPGDVDFDGDTDLSDLAGLLASYGASPGDPNWNAAADFDGDNDVDLSDLALLLSDYGCGT